MLCCGFNSTQLKSQSDAMQKSIGIQTLLAVLPMNFLIIYAVNGPDISKYR